MSETNEKNKETSKCTNKNCGKFYEISLPTI